MRRRFALALAVLARLLRCDGDASSDDAPSVLCAVAPTSFARRVAGESGGGSATRDGGASACELSQLAIPGTASTFLNTLLRELLTSSAAPSRQAAPDDRYYDRAIIGNRTTTIATIAPADDARAAARAFASVRGLRFDGNGAHNPYELARHRPAAPCVHDATMVRDPAVWLYRLHQRFGASLSGRTGIRPSRRAVVAKHAHTHAHDTRHRTVAPAAAPRRAHLPTARARDESTSRLTRCLASFLSSLFSPSLSFGCVRGVAGGAGEVPISDTSRGCGGGGGGRAAAQPAARVPGRVRSRAGLSEWSPRAWRDLQVSGGGFRSRARSKTAVTRSGARGATCRSRAAGSGQERVLRAQNRFRNHHALGNDIAS